MGYVGGGGPLPSPYFAQSLRNRYFMLVLVLGVSSSPEQPGGSWGEVLSTFVASVLVLDSALVLGSAVHLHPDDATIGIDVHRA
jgi:hypothetical protein